MVVLPGYADDAADNGEQDRLSQELRPDLALRRTKGATEADLRAEIWTFLGSDRLAARCSSTGQTWCSTATRAPAASRPRSTAPVMGREFGGFERSAAERRAVRLAHTPARGPNGHRTVPCLT
jgi:hypothetical protein